MREIKFRAWNSIDKCFCDNSTTLTNLRGFIKSKHYHPMQYTGLQDKNGVEIYEGDIVAKKGLDTDSEEYRKWMDNTDYSDSVDSDLESSIPIINQVVDVVTMERFPRYWLKNESFGFEGEDLEYPSCFEVIGNIYENPELLKAPN